MVSRWKTGENSESASCGTEGRVKPRRPPGPAAGRAGQGRARQGVTGRAHLADGRHVQQLPEDVDARGLQHLVDETGERCAAGSLGQQQELFLALPRHLPLGRHPAAAGVSAPPRWRPAGPGPAAGRHLQPAPRPLLYGGGVARPSASGCDATRAERRGAPRRRRTARAGRAGRSRGRLPVLTGIAVRLAPLGSSELGARPELGLHAEAAGRKGAQCWEAEVEV